MKTKQLKPELKHKERKKQVRFFTIFQFMIKDDEKIVITDKWYDYDDVKGFTIPGDYTMQYISGPINERKVCSNEPIKIDVFEPKPDPKPKPKRKVKNADA